MQRVADEAGLVLHRQHYPPGTSERSKIEHRLFCRITQNWRGHSLTDRLAMIDPIGVATTKTGLKLDCALDPRRCEKA